MWEFAGDTLRVTGNVWRLSGNRLLSGVTGKANHQFNYLLRTDKRRCDLATQVDG